MGGIIIVDGGQQGIAPWSTPEFTATTGIVAVPVSVQSTPLTFMRKSSGGWNCVWISCHSFMACKCEGLQRGMHVCQGKL